MSVFELDKGFSNFIRICSNAIHRVKFSIPFNKSDKSAMRTSDNKLIIILPPSKLESIFKVLRCKRKIERQTKNQQIKIWIEKTYLNERIATKASRGRGAGE